MSTALEKNTPVIKYIEILSYVFLGLGVITSQLNIVSSSVGVGGLIILTIARIITDKSLRFEDKRLIWFAVLFIAAQVLSSVFSGDPAHSFNNIYRKISLYIVFFSAIITITNEKDLQRFLAVFFIFTAVISTVEIAQYVTDFKTLSEGKPLSEVRLEYYGYPITNAEIKMLVLLIIIPLIFSTYKFILKKIILIVLFLPLLFSFYLTNARNAFLGLVAGLFIYGLLVNRKFLTGLVVFLVLFIAFAPLPVKERILSIGDLNHPSNHSRIVMWETGWKMIKDNAVIGIGDVDIKKAYEQYKKPEFHGEGSHMHNNIIQITLTTGFLGLVIWLCWMLYIFYRQVLIFFATKNYDFLNIMAVSSLCSMAAFQVAGLTEWNFGDAEFAVVMWFSLAMAFIVLKLKDLKPNEA